MRNDYERAKDMLEKYNQNHVVSFIDNANEAIKLKLINQVLKIDFDQLKELYEKTFEEIYVDLEELQPIEGVNPITLEKDELNRYEKLGVDVIKNNKFAVVTMAGGQGTRLRTF